MRNILIANVGSTSYKYALYGVSSSGAASELARGGIGGVSDFSSAITDSLASLSSSGFDTEGISAVAFKTVLGKDLSGLREADESVLEALDAMADVAPAHNPPYAAAIRAFGKILPRARLVALFETSFYQWADPAWRRYAVPASWDAAGIRRNGFHGATHKYAAERVAEMCGRQDAAESARMLYVRGAPMNLDKAFRHVNCHLGGSSSVCGILNGAAVGSSMGFTPQSGLPQNNRVGDLDAMAVPFAMKTFGIGAEEAARQLSSGGGLLGISGVSNDIRQIHLAAESGNSDAKLAIEVLAYSARAYIGWFAAQLGGLDAISFSGGIGENDFELRSQILEPLASFGVRLDSDSNRQCVQKREGIISAGDSGVKLAVVAANEESVIAREAARYLENS